MHNQLCKKFLYSHRDHRQNLTSWCQSGITPLQKYVRLTCLINITYLLT